MAAHLSHALITVSPHDIDKGLEWGIGKPEQYTVIRSGVELDRFGHPKIAPEQMRAGLGLPATAPVVGSVTRLSPQKAPLDLVDAFGYIGRERPDVWFVVVGDGPLRAPVEQRLQEARIANRTILTGLRRDVPELMATFDVFTLSSLWEGLPRVLPQAMATGLPIVCTRAGGAAEAVIDGENGFLVNRERPRELAESVLLLLQNEALRKRLGQAGKERAPAFGARRMVQDIDALYRQLLAEV
jgi:glycosyltransferase involved in cell wall biosynthesis